jgi:hypothetical protein
VTHGDNSGAGVDNPRRQHSERRPQDDTAFVGNGGGLLLQLMTTRL